MAQAASALIFGSPEYHGSFGAGLKNLVDHLDTTLVEGKPAALVAASGSPRGGMATLSVMRHVLRRLHVPAIVEQMPVCPQDRDPRSGQCSEGLLAQADPLVAGLLRQLVPPASTRGVAGKCSDP